MNTSPPLPLLLRVSCDYALFLLKLHLKIFSLIPDTLCVQTLIMYWWNIKMKSGNFEIPLTFKFWFNQRFNPKVDWRKFHGIYWCLTSAQFAAIYEKLPIIICNFENATTAVQLHLLDYFVKCFFICYYFKDEAITFANEIYYFVW